MYVRGCEIEGMLDNEGKVIEEGEVINVRKITNAQNIRCFIFGSAHEILVFIILYDVASESEITPCVKINKALVVYRFSGNIMKLCF